VGGYRGDTQFQLVFSSLQWDFDKDILESISSSSLFPIHHSNHNSKYSTTTRKFAHGEYFALKNIFLMIFV